VRVRVVALVVPEGRQAPERVCEQQKHGRWRAGVL